MKLLVYILTYVITLNSLLAQNCVYRYSADPYSPGGSTFCFSGQRPDDFGSLPQGIDHDRHLSEISAKYQSRLQEIELRTQARVAQLQEQVQRKLQEIERQFENRIRIDHEIRQRMGELEANIDNRVDELRESFEQTRESFKESILSQFKLNEFRKGFIVVQEEVSVARDEIDKSIRVLEVNNDEEIIYGQYLKYEEKLKEYEEKLYTMAEKLLSELNKEVTKEFVESINKTANSMKKSLSSIAMRELREVKFRSVADSSFAAEENIKRVFSRELSKQDRILAVELGFIDKEFEKIPAFRSKDEVFKKNLKETWERGNSLKPRYYQQKRARTIGLSLLVDADEHSVRGLNKSAREILEYAKSFVDFASGLIPITAIPRDFYELLTGEDLFTGQRLNHLERSLSFLGVATLGGSTLLKNALKASWILIKSLKKTITVLSRTESLGYIVKLEKSFNQANRIADAATDIGLTRASITSRFLRSSTGRVWFKIKASGKISTEYGFKVFRKDVHSVELPVNGEFARIMPKDYAKKLLKGEGDFSRIFRDPSTGRTVNESFITAYDDIKNVTGYEGVAKKLALFDDVAATNLRSLSENDVIVRFKFKAGVERSLRTPIETPRNLRKYGFLPGGRTAGGAREWLIDSDSVKKGFVDMESIVIERIKK